MAVTYESVPAIIPNTEMRKKLFDGVHRNYMIKPADGYVMHDVNYDYLEERISIDPITGEEVTEYVTMLGYRPTEGSVSANYDFTPTEMLDEAGNTVTAYGSRQFFCKPIADVPENQIFGVTNPPAEVM